MIAWTHQQYGNLEHPTQRLRATFDGTVAALALYSLYRAPLGFWSPFKEAAGWGLGSATVRHLLAIPGLISRKDIVTASRDDYWVNGGTQSRALVAFACFGAFALLRHRPTWGGTFAGFLLGDFAIRFIADSFGNSSIKNKNSLSIKKREDSNAHHRHTSSTGGRDRGSLGGSDQPQGPK